MLGWCLYVYRDLWPLLTYHLMPTDLDNKITWIRVGLLSLVAVAIPLIRPRTYVPADPENPTPPDQIHPEQTASWLSFLFYEFMTPLVWKAWKSPALPYDDLQPMADYDRAAHLHKHNGPNLDPIKRRQRGLKRRHLFPLLINTYRFEAVMTSLMCVLCAVFELSGSVAINQLLAYLEGNASNSQIRPIVWICLLFIGPIIASISIQYYVFLMTRALVRTESLLTQLLFDHALRLRMRDTTDDEDSKSVAQEPTDAPGPIISVENVDGAESGSTTEVASSDGSNGKDGSKKAAADKEAAKNKGQGLAGKINVLISTDVESVIEGECPAMIRRTLIAGRDLPLVFVFTPIQLALCVIFLYKILSWSSLVGMLVMVATMPIPGVFTKYNAKFQQERMLATDARVDAITEAIGALRMIKMFAWESRIEERISTKREVELQALWKRRIAELAANLSGILLPTLTMMASIGIYTVVEKKALTASKVFTASLLFELLKGQIGLVVYMINGFVTAGVSLQRINDFLQNSEMIDEFTEGMAKPLSRDLVAAQEQGLIRIRNALFTWGSSKGADTPDFKLRIPDVTFVKGKINVIAGPTGSGKSSLLKVGARHIRERV